MVTLQLRPNIGKKNVGTRTGIFKEEESVCESR